MLNKEEATRLQRICREFTAQVEFAVHQTNVSEFGRSLEDFVDEVCRVSQGKIRATACSTDSRLPALPCFRMGIGQNLAIFYAAVPLGHQFGPFLGALEIVGRNRSIASDIGPPMGRRPAELQVFVSEHCPRCPLVVEAAVSLSNRQPSISTFVVEAARFPDLTQKYGIKSVPATVLDGRLVLIGSISADKLANLIEIRGTPQFEMEVVRSLIDTSRIAEAAECLNMEAGREVILDLLQSPDFSKRLSALVVLERALDDRPNSVRTLVPSLIAMLSHKDSRIRGDIADLLGKTGDPRAIPKLEPLKADPDPDVADAAVEAIEELRKLQ
jgi:hypothetical protein